MKTMKIKLFAMMVCVAALTLSVFADAKSDAHKRRKARKNEVAVLVSSGDASEGSNGYLVAKKELSAAKQAVVKAENKDRKIGYEAIAKQHNTSVEAISIAAGKINRKKKK
ncbi:MAG: DUF1318 domain-containing protein [Kiritimatiellae bacterium]|nr:DUF1318 domain-containing protein [Kiritimatiellia bacterium]